LRSNAAVPASASALLLFERLVVVRIDLQGAFDQRRGLARELPVLGHCQRVGVVRQQVGIVRAQVLGPGEGVDRLAVLVQHHERARQHQPAVGVVRVAREARGEAVRHRRDAFGRDVVRRGVGAGVGRDVGRCGDRRGHSIEIARGAEQQVAAGGHHCHEQREAGGQSWRRPAGGSHRLRGAVRAECIQQLSLDQRLAARMLLVVERAIAVESIELAQLRGQRVDLGGQAGTTADDPVPPGVAGEEQGRRGAQPGRDADEQDHGLVSASRDSAMSGS
jgi:hypothetical protein